MHRSLLETYKLTDYPFRINWEITRVCNFSCPYCVNRQGESDAIQYVFNPDEIAEFFNRTGQQWLILITGGEPFVYPRFAEVCRELTRNHYIQITSNLSHPDVVFFSEQVDPGKVFLISASFHATERRSEKLRNEFIERCILLKNKGFNVLINYIAHPDTFKQLDEDIQHFTNLGFGCFTLALRGRVNGLNYPESYTSEQWDIINKYALDTDIEKKAAYGNLNFYGRYCQAGKYYFFMKPDGSVSRCATLQKSCGNLFEGSFTPGPEIRPCIAINCYDVYCGLAALSGKKASLFAIHSEKKRYSKSSCLGCR